MRHYLSTAILCVSLFLLGSCQSEKTDYVAFLYKYMPTSDSVDYSREYWERQVAMSERARKEMPWAQLVPEMEWKHFVVPVRVNNEALDEARSVIYEELAPRIMNMSMEEAALEVNHWCHEKVSYQPSDGRTSPPLTTMANAIGRCGEESTFTVAAMRAVGIPARQVYCPRWSHTDSNHAWVEVWIADDDKGNGRWRFMGACEPEAVLDKGWFNWAASRAMLVHTRVFGAEYEGKEEILDRTKCYTEINCLPTYAPTKNLKVLVQDAEGKPIENATVDFRVYNYAEFYPIASQKTDAEGKAAFTTGLGDLVVWVSTGDAFNAVYVPADMENVTITPSLTANSVHSQELDLYAPVSSLPEPDRSIVDTVSVNGRRLLREDSIRVAYQQARFYWGEDEILRKARSNWEVIEEFLEQADDEQAARNYLLTGLSEKDLRDATMEALLDSATRIGTEPLRPYMEELQQLLPAGLTPDTWLQWVDENIKVDDESNPIKVHMSAVAVAKHKVTDSRSLEIFKVAGARALGMKSYLDATGKAYVEGSTPEAQNTGGNGTLQVNAPENVRYFTDFSLSLLVDGRPQSLNFDDEDTTIQNPFKEGMSMPEGSYLLITGTRLQGGDVLASYQIVQVKAGEKTEVTITPRQSEKKATHDLLNLQDSDKDASATSIQGA
ncbi:MAG: transglutaminase domain-containing protein [Bacteroidaceae bacterium]|nr:transglutaminase domain-containing protein [Bacteroidaceae bacterium]MBQ5839527.1 transglutaminase domain-containing protein [Bacteroidaceae bacterium]